MLEYLSGLIGELDIKTKILPFCRTKDAYQYALERTIDLFIIDIILDTSCQGDSSGLKFVDNIRQVKHYSFTPVIFVTALEDSKSYTYEKLHCYRFLEKPFDPQALKRLVEQCLCFPNSRREEKNIYFRKDGIVLAVDRNDIVYAECINHTTYIHTKRGDVLDIAYMSLKKLMEEIDSPDMERCSRSTIINIRFIHNVDITNRIVQFKDGLGSIEIGATYKKYMKENFQ